MDGWGDINGWGEVEIRGVHQGRGHLDGFLGSSNHRRVGCHINAIGSCQGIDQGQVPNMGKVLVTGPTNQLEPVPLAE